MHRLDGCIEEVFEGGFDDHHLVESFPCFKVLVFYFMLFIFVEGRVNFVGTRIDRVNPGAVGVHGIDSSKHDHAEPSMLPPPCCWMKLQLHSADIACRVL